MVTSKSVIAQTIETMQSLIHPAVTNPQIKVDGMPEGIAVNEKTNKIYIWNPSETTNAAVSVINSNSGAVKNIRVGNSSQYMLEGRSGSVPLPIAVDSFNNKIYVANPDSNTVSVIGGSDDTQITQIKVGTKPIFILLSYFFNKLNIYVANTNNNTVSVIDGNNYHHIIQITVGNRPMYMATGKNGKIYVANSGNDSVSLITPQTRQFHFSIPIKVGQYPTFIAYNSKNNKIYVANSGNNTVSVIDGDTDTKIGDIQVGVTPTYIAFDNTNKIYVANSGNNTVSVIDGDTDTKIGDIQVGKRPTNIALDNTNKIYVTRWESNDTVYVIEGSHVGGGGGDKRESHDILVGSGPGPLAINYNKRLIYVGNILSNTVSVINGFSSKVAAGVTFNVNPVGSGTIMCDNQSGTNQIEYPTNVYIYVDNGTRCTGEGNTNFEFDRWVQNINRNSSLPVDEPSGYLTVDRYGNFTANFKPVPPPIPPEYWSLIITLILTTIIGWSIPSIAGWLKTRTQLKHLKECINQIGRLDKNAIENKMKEYYVRGKISEDHRQFLKDKISEYYDSVKGSE